MPQTSYSDFWGAYTMLINRSANERAVTRRYRKMKERRAIGLALNGQAVGAGTALATTQRVAASAVEQGQIRPIETRTIINRVTTAADKTRQDAQFLKSGRITQTAANANKAGIWPA